MQGDRGGLTLSPNQGNEGRDGRGGGPVSAGTAARPSDPWQAWCATHCPYCGVVTPGGVKCGPCAQRRAHLRPLVGGASTRPPLTREQIAAGYHYCPEWDHDLIGPEDPQWEACLCAGFGLDLEGGG